MKPGRRSTLTVAVAMLVLTSAGIAIAQTNGQTDSTPTENATNADDSSWSTHRADDGRTGATMADGPAPYPTVAWDDAFTGQPVAAPSVANDSAYLGVTTEAEYYKNVGAIVAYDRTDGDVQWSRTSLGSPAGSPTVVDDTVYAATRSAVHSDVNQAEDGEGGLYAFDTGTGDTVWKRNESEEWLSSPVHEDGRLYVVRGGDNSSLLALDPSTGNTTWSTPADGLVGAANGTIVVTHDDQLLAYDLATHDQAWQVDRPTEFDDKKAAVTADGVYGVSDVVDDQMYASAFSLSSGETRWNATVANDSSESFAPAVANGTVYLTTQDERANKSVVALDAVTGDVEWTFDVGDGHLISGPTVANDSVLVVGETLPETNEPGESYRGYAAALYSIDATNGSQEWGYFEGTRYGDWQATAPSVVGDDVYIPSNGDYVYPQESQGRLQVFESSETSPPPSQTPSDGFYENDTEPTLSIETSAEDPSEEFGDEKTVRLNASASVGQGEIESYAWDLDDDGTYERNGASITVTLEQCEEREITAKVTASNNQTSTETVTIKNAA